MVFLYSKYFHLALVVPHLNLSAAGFMSSPSLANLTYWLCLLVIALDIGSYSSLVINILPFLTLFPLQQHFFSLPLFVGGCVCVSLRGVDWKPQLWSGLVKH